MRSLRQDVSFAFRLMRRAPVATLAAIVTFALGLGANIAIFSVAWPVLFAPLPFADEARLTVVQLIFTRGGRRRKLVEMLPAGSRALERAYRDFRVMTDGLERRFGQR